MSSVAIPFPPLLREGDRLHALDFLRRWEAMPELKHAELIDGVVFMAFPVGATHALLHQSFSGWLWLYSTATTGCQSGIEGTWLMGPKQVPQPDLAMRILPEFGGQSHQAGDYFSGAPELIIEITGSSMSRDLGVKLDLYRKAGVREYLTILLKPQRIVWRHLSRGRYKDLAVSGDGHLKSLVFPGLWLDPEAVWDPKRSFRAAIESGLLSPGHAAFVRSLKNSGPRKP